MSAIEGLVVSILSEFHSLVDTGKYHIVSAL